MTRPIDPLRDVSAAAFALACAGAAPLLAETLAERAAPCLACHGEKGDVGNAGNAIARRPAGALSADPALSVPRRQRASTFKKDDQMIQVMTEMTKGFTDDDLRNFSDFIAKLPPPQPSADAADAARMAARPRADHAAPLQLVSQSRSVRQRERPAHRRAARGLSASRRCASTRATPGTATTAPWPRCCTPVTDAQIVDLAYYIARFR